MWGIFHKPVFVQKIIEQMYTKMLSFTHKSHRSFHMLDAVSEIILISL